MRALYVYSIHMHMHVVCAHICVQYACVYACSYKFGDVCVCVHVWADLRLMLEIILHCSPTLFTEAGLLVNPELAG